MSKTAVFTENFIDWSWPRIDSKVNTSNPSTRLFTTPVESIDLLFYLVLETSFYTQQQFKAFHSLQTYDQMVSGFIASVQGHILADKFVVLAKVRHYIV